MTTRLAPLISKTLMYAIAGLLAVIYVLPFLWMYLSSFKNVSEIIRIPPTLLPIKFTLKSYAYIFTELHFIRYFINSAIFAGMITATVLFTSSLAGFLFAKYRFPGKELIFKIIISTMMIPFAATAIPLYQIVARFHWVNTYPGMIIPLLISAFGIFLMRQFMESLPVSYLEAARMDGANDWWMYLKLALPHAKPAFSALGIFVFMWSWNFLLWPLIVANKPELRTLTTAIALMSSSQVSYGVRFDLIVTGAAVAIIPTLIFYLVAHRNFVKGLSFTGLKY